MPVEQLNDNFVKASSSLNFNADLINKFDKLNLNKISFVPLQPIKPMSKVLKIKHPVFMAVSIGTALTYGLGNLICEGVKKLDQSENEKMNKLVYLS